MWAANLALASIVVLCVGACSGGGSQTAPTPAVQTLSTTLNGLWLGTWQFTQNGLSLSDTASLTFRRGTSPSSVSATLQTGNGTTGTLSITSSDSALSGTIRLTHLLRGSECPAEGTIQGNVEGDRLALSNESLISSCHWSSNNEFEFQKQ